MILEIALFLLEILLPMLWVLFGAPLMFRLFGVSIPLNPRKRMAIKPNMNQSLLQAILLDGVLSFGVAMFIFTLSDHYVQLRLHHSPSDQLVFQTLVIDLCKCLTGGVLFGLLRGFDGGKPARN